MFIPIESHYFENLSIPLQSLAKILRQASELLNQQYQLYQQDNNFLVQEKKDRSPVTQADLKCHEFLMTYLPQIENIPILSEEGSHDERQSWQRFWLIDPLDGTKEFLYQSGQFTINVSIVEHGETVLSAVAVPQKNAIYLNENNQLPYKLTWENQQEFQIFQYCHAKKQDEVLKLTMTRRPEKYPLYQQYMQFLQEKNIPFENIQAGSAYKFCLMLEDEVDLYVRFHPTSEWDTSAGQGLLRGVGGEIWSEKKKPFIYNQRDSLENGYFIAVKNQQDWYYVDNFIDKYILNK